jgi:cytochrome c-type biogenesis protein CcsB
MTVLLSFASHFYLFAAILYVAYVVKSHPRLAQVAKSALAVGFALQTVLIVHNLVRYGYSPMSNLSEGLSFLGWLLVGGFLVVEHLYHLPIIGTFVTPLVVGVLLPAVLLRNQQGQIAAAIKIPGMPLHVVIAFAGIAAFALSTGVSVAYLLMERQVKGKKFGVLFSRLPSLEVLDELSDKLTRWGFVALSITMISGAIFARRAWGEYWRWDPKLTLSLVGWLVYAALVHARLFAGWRGRRAAVLTMVGFLILFGSFVGLKLFPMGSHSGDFQ